MASHNHLHHDSSLRKLMSKPENKVCFDCYSRYPAWASVTYGVFICAECAEFHRSFRVDLSVVRSTSLDSWGEEEVKVMRVGGNGRAAAFFKQHGWKDKEKENMNGGNNSYYKMECKYTSPAAYRYRQLLAQLAEVATSNNLLDADYDDDNDDDDDSMDNITSTIHHKTDQAPHNSPTTYTLMIRSREPGPSPPTVREKKKLGVKKLTKNVNQDIYDQQEKDQEKDVEDSSWRKINVFTSIASSSSGGHVSAPLPKRNHLFMDFDNSTDFQISSSSRGTSTSSSSPSSFSSAEFNIESNEAREKFGTAKSISSSQFFSKGDAENVVDNYSQVQLQNFANATSISSSDFFERKELNDSIGFEISDELFSGVTLEGMVILAEQVRRMLSSLASNLLSELQK